MSWVNGREFSSDPGGATNVRLCHMANAPTMFQYFIDEIFRVTMNRCLIIFIVYINDSSTSPLDPQDLSKLSPSETSTLRCTSFINCQCLFCGEFLCETA